MCSNAIKIPTEKLPDLFANLFFQKVNDIVSNAVIDSTIYNGKKKINGNSTMFMNKEAIVECLKSIKIKNTEGFDRIPQRILVDGSENLIDPLTELFGLIYNHNQLPERWLIAKTNVFNYFLIMFCLFFKDSQESVNSTIKFF